MSFCFPATHLFPKEIFPFHESEIRKQWTYCLEHELTVELFRTAVNELLLRGRSKNRSRLLTRPTNCGKSFLLNPLKVIYRTFSNPATGTFAWVGIKNVECILLLNDFRWSAQIILWHDLLLMLEGNVVHSFARAKDPLFYRHLVAKRHSDPCHRERPPNLCQERSNWPTKNGYGVLKVENFEAASSSFARGAAGNTALPKVLL